MGDFKINEKSVFTQSGSAEPVLASTVTGGAGLSGMTSLGTVTSGTLGSGVVQKIHAVSAYLSGTDCSIATSTWTEFTGTGTWTERFDSHAHYDTGTGRFTQTVQGVYLCGYSIFCVGLDADEVITAHVRRNSSMSVGDYFASGEDGFESGSTDKVSHFSGSGLIQLDTDDYVSGWCRHTEGASQTLQNGYTEFWATYIGTV